MNMRIFRYLKEHNLELERTESKHHVFTCTHCWENERVIYDVKGKFACQDCIHSDSFYEKMQKLVQKIKRRKLPLMEIRE
ncbi:MAG: hypothetical protein GOVbin556_33 [Prokaryotic dsDNA virus sp.]|nr:MAG: hypothetical protein GOVbin556_33 [Prokaryotic dsDNA virus sp.]|tara:strand:+ start:456 stop:695 length:240 start_codon:yes stop_codon:yes gene_type:complete